MNHSSPLRACVAPFFLLHCEVRREANRHTHPVTVRGEGGGRRGSPCRTCFDIPVLCLIASLTRSAFALTTSSPRFLQWNPAEAGDSALHDICVSRQLHASCNPWGDPVVYVSATWLDPREQETQHPVPPLTHKMSFYSSLVLAATLR